jgi:hypothetical protein
MVRSRRSRQFVFVLSAALVVTMGSLATSATATASVRTPPAPKLGKDSQIFGTATYSNHDAWGVGDSVLLGCDLHPLIEHWNGRQWSRIPANVPASWSADLWAVAVTSPANAWAVGGYQTRHARCNGPVSIHPKPAPKSHPLVEHWNGSRWSILHIPYDKHVDGILTSLSALSPSDIWASGSASWGSARYSDTSTRPLIERFDGRQWRIVRMPNQPIKHRDIYQILAVSADDVWIVGDHWNPHVGPHTIWVKTLIEHWNGAQWSIVPSPNTSCHQNVLGSIHITGPHDGWATGGGNYCRPHASPGNRSFRLHWNGIRWALVHQSRT